MTVLQAFATPILIAGIVLCLAELCGNRALPNNTREKR